PGLRTALPDPPYRARGFALSGVSGAAGATGRQAEAAPASAGTASVAARAAGRLAEDVTYGASQIHMRGLQGGERWHHVHRRGVGRRRTEAESAVLPSFCSPSLS